MGKKWGILVLVLLLLVPVVLAQESRQDRTKLLALINKGDTQYGTAETLDLDLQPGKERVFLETFPLTKISTQVSVRFAQQIACSELDMDCSDYDFFYTIRALPGVVGGPSAGAAAAVLTAALLLDKPMDEKVAITGTINSGGIIAFGNLVAGEFNLPLGLLRRHDHLPFRPDHQPRRVECLQEEYILVVLARAFVDPDQGSVSLPPFLCDLESSERPAIRRL